MTRIKTMIALAAIATALPAATITAADAWHRVGGNANSATYIDASTIRRGGTETEAIAKSYFAKPIGDRVYSASIRYSFNCAGGYYRSLAYIHYGVNNEELSNHASTTSDQRRTPEPGRPSV